MKELLIRGTNWIGDSIMTVPALRELRRLLPDTRITLMVRPWVRELFEGQDFIDSVLECDDIPGTWQPWFRNIKRMRQGNFNAALLFPNAISPALQASAAGIPHRLGYATDGRSPFLTHSAHKSARLKNRHQCYHYLNLLHALELSSVDYLAEPDFHPDATLTQSPSFRRRAQETAARFGISPDSVLVGIHAGAYYGAAKRWFPERFAHVADALIESHGAQIVLLGSSEELRIANIVIAATKGKACCLAGKTGLGELMDLLARCNLLITNDSGPMHLAASLDTPLLAIFGSTDARATAPLSPRARLIRKEVACSPCLLRECPLDLRCFQAVTAGEVIAAAREQLNLTQSERQTKRCSEQYS